MTKERCVRSVSLETKVASGDDLVTVLYEFYQPDYLLGLEDRVADSCLPEPDKVCEEDLKRFM